MRNETPHAQATQPVYRWFVALGSNIGDGIENLRTARRALQAYGVVHAASPIYETAPMYDTDQARFSNAVLELHSAYEGPALLQELQKIERELGRARDAMRRYGPRAIDLDIVGGMHGDEAVTITREELQIPHPRMHERAFVLVPLASIVSQWRHPLRDESLQTLLERAGNDDSLRQVCAPEDWA